MVKQRRSRTVNGKQMEGNLGSIACKLETERERGRKKTEVLL